MPGCNYGNSRAHLSETEHTQISLKHWFYDLFPQVCVISQTLLTIFQQKKKSSLMVSISCLPGSPLLLIPRPFSVREPGSSATPEVTDGTGINLCSGFIAKVSRKRPALFRGFRGTLIFFFSQVLLKCTF